MHSCSDSSEDLEALFGVENFTSEDEHRLSRLSSTLAIPRLTKKARKDEAPLLPWSDHHMV